MKRFFIPWCMAALTAGCATSFAAKAADRVMADHALTDQSGMRSTPQSDTGAATYQSDMSAAAMLIYHLSKFDYPTDFAKKPGYGHQLLSNYVDQLDPEHLFFSAEDVSNILQSSDAMPVALLGKDLTVANAVAARHANRVKDRIGYALTLIQKGFTFDGQDTIVITASSAPDFLPEQALKARWEKIIKSEWLDLKLDGLADAQIKERLQSRYSHFAQALIDNDRTFALVRYVNAVIVGGDPAGGYGNAAHGEKKPDASLPRISLPLNDDIDGPFIGVSVGDGATRLNAGDRLVGLSVNGAVTYLDGMQAVSVVALLKSLPQGADVRFEVRRSSALPGAPVVEVPYDPNAAPDKTKLTMQLIAPSGATHGERVAVISMPAMYGITRRKSDGFTSKERVDVDLREALTQAQAQGAVAVVVDLRNDSGGFMGTAARVAQAFLGNRSPWRVQTPTATTAAVPDDDGSMEWDVPLAVLVNGRTAEGGEMVAAALQDYGRALIVGEKTAGIGTIGTVVDLGRIATPTGAATSGYGSLKMTVSGVFRADGESIAGHGVTPDVMVPQPHADGFWLKEAPFPSIAPVTVDGFAAFQAADAQVARRYQRGNDSTRHRDADAAAQPEAVLSLNFARRKAEQPGHPVEAPAGQGDATIKEAVDIAYAQSRAVVVATSSAGNAMQR